MVDAIIEGAARVFEVEGLDATTNRIAETAGVSVGSVYQYFADKQALLKAVAMRHLDQGEALLNQLRVALAEETELGAIVRAYVDAIARHHRRHPAVHALFEEHIAASPAIRSRVEHLRDAVRDDLMGHMQRLRPELEQPAIKAGILAAAMGAGVHEAVLGSPEPAAATDELVRLCVGYLD